MTSWRLVSLEDIAEVTAGNPAPQEPGDFAPVGPPFVRMQDVGRAHHSNALIETTDRLAANSAQRHRLRLFPKGTLLIPKSGASVNLNHRALLGVDAYVVSHLATVVPNTNIVDPEFLYYWSLTYDPRRQAQTTSLPSLQTSLIKAAKLLLPSLEEQRGIVDLLSRAEGIVRLRREAQKKAAEIIPALFIDMFGDPATNPMGWKIVSLGNLLSSADYGSSKKASDHATGLPMIRMGNVDYAGNLDLSDLKYVELPPNDVDRFKIERGDILFNRTNSKELVGKTALWEFDLEAIAASYFIRLRVVHCLARPFFVWAFMNIPYMKRIIFDTARGAIGQANINSKELKAFRLPLPSLDVQAKFEERCQSVLGIAAQQTEAFKKAEAAFQSLLTRALGTASLPAEEAAVA